MNARTIKAFLGNVQFKRVFFALTARHTHQEFGGGAVYAWRVFLDGFSQAVQFLTQYFKRGQRGGDCVDAADQAECCVGFYSSP